MNKDDGDSEPVAVQVPLPADVEVAMGEVEKGQDATTEEVGKKRKAQTLVSSPIVAKRMKTSNNPLLAANAATVVPPTTTTTTTIVTTTKSEEDEEVAGVMSGMYDDPCDMSLEMLLPNGENKNLSVDL